MDKDSSLYDVPKGYYLDALNITKNDISENNDRSATNVIGNQLVAYTYPAGTGKYIGSFPFQLRNTVIGFRWNVNGYHGIYEYNHTTRAINKIFESRTDSDDIDILNFTRNGKITSVNVYPRDEGDLLFFLDSLGRPTEMDILKFKAGEYTPVTRAIIDKGKKPPLSPPSVVYDNDTTVRSNDLRNKLFRFKYRFHYDDFETSVFSPISVVPLPVSILSDIYTNVITNNNVIRMSLNSGDKNVKSVEIAMSYVNKTNDWSDFQSIKVIDKTSLIFSASTEIVVNDFGSEAVITLTGSVAIGTEINIYLTQLPSTETLIATYTTIIGDTPETVAAALVLSMIALGITTNQGSTGSILYAFYNDSTYTWNRIDIDAPSVNVDNIDFPYSFYNDSTYPDVDINESIQLFDYVPDLARAQDMPNGNVLAYAAITEGYTKDTVPNSIITVGTVAAGNGGVVGNLAALVNTRSETGPTALVDIHLSGIPATGTVINLRLKTAIGHTVILAGTYTTIAGETVTSIILNIDYSVGGVAITDRNTSAGNFRSTISQANYEPFPSGAWITVEIIAPTSATATNSIATWPFSTSRSIARAYFDIKGKTNGILYTDKVIFPAYAENGSQQVLIPFINYKINDVPPVWAYSMNFYFTKDATNYIVWESLSVQIETEYIYFEVTSFIANATKKPTTAQVLSYSFQDADRLRIWRDTDSPGSVFDDTYDSAIEGLVDTPTINSTVTPTGSLWLKIKNVEPFTSSIVTTKNYVLFIYRPAQQSSNAENLVYYELGRQYDIIDPTLTTRRHSGEVTDQVVGVTPAEYNFYEGDTYFRSRTIATTDTGYATFNVIDRNFVDFFISAVNSIDGRPNIIDINARRQYYSTLIRFGQAYQANTNINGLNRFYPNNFDEYDYNFGDVVRLKVRDRYLKVFQKFKIGVVPLYGQITKDANGNQSLVVTDKLLNPIQYRIGNFGLSAPESLASWHFADYGCDTNTGDIWRDSNDGVLSISKIYKMDSWALVELPLRTGDTKIYGAIDPKTNQYIIALEAYTVPVPSFVINAIALNSIDNGFTIISTVNFTVDWGDGTTDTFVAGTRTPTHTYSAPYTGEIKVSASDLSLISGFAINSNTGISPIIGALTIATTELNKLTGLGTLVLGINIFMDGTAGDLPPAMTFIATYRNNLSGSVADLPTTLTHIDIQGSNTLSGTTAQLPSGTTYLILYGGNTLSGDVANLPSGLTLLAVNGSNTLSGDVAGLPNSITYLQIIGLNTISGDIAGLPPSLNTGFILGVNTISGDVSDIPATVISITVVGNNTITGDIATMPSAMIQFQIAGNNTLFGDLAFIPNGVVFILINSATNNVNAYTPSVRTWSTTMKTVSIFSGVTGFSATEVDNILIELAAQVSTWLPNKIVSLLGSSAVRTAASDAAVTTLTGQGVTVSTN